MDDSNHRRSQMKEYIYKPTKFHVIAYASTWFFWMLAIMFNEGMSLTVFMLLGLLCPAAVAVLLIAKSNNSVLRKDFAAKLLDFKRLRPVIIIEAVAAFMLIAAASILLSTVFGQSLDQFGIRDFTFSISGVSSLAVIILASLIEEIGWRGYAEDSIAQYHTWFGESVIFGIVWPLWHLPLFWIPGTYHIGLMSLGWGYVLNFFVSGFFLGYLTTWVYVKNDRSMLASIIFHLFVNLIQEKVAMTPQTKCVETIVVAAAAAAVVLTNREMFFETRHIGRLPMPDNGKE